MRPCEEQKCSRRGTTWVVSPGGQRVHIMCREHAIEKVEENRRLWGEVWTHEAVDPCRCGHCKTEHREHGGECQLCPCIRFTWRPA